MTRKSILRLTVLSIASLLFFIACNTIAAQVKDESYTTEEYIARGVPSPKRVWTAHEFSTAIDALKILKDSNANTIPLKDSPKSGELFNRLTNVENLNAISDTSADLSLRLNEFGVYSMSFSKLLMFYYEPTAKVQRYGKETIYVMVFALKVMQNGMEAGGEARAAMPSEQMEKGYGQMKSGFGTFTRGALTTLTEAESYKHEDLIYLSNQLKPFLEKTWQVHDASTRQELAVYIKSIIAKTKIKEIRENLQQLNLD